MEFQQSEFRVVDSLFEKSSVGFVPDIFHGGSVFDKFNIADKSHAVATEKIANTCFGALFKVSRFAVDFRALGCEKYMSEKPSAFAIDITQVRG